jgi:hypothetical protein
LQTDLQEEIRLQPEHSKADVFASAANLNSVDNHQEVRHINRGMPVEPGHQVV